MGIVVKEILLETNCWVRLQVIGIGVKQQLRLQFATRSALWGSMVIGFCVRPLIRDGCVVLCLEHCERTICCNSILRVSSD